MEIVNTQVPITSQSCEEMIRALTQNFPDCRSRLLTTTAFQRPVEALILGKGPRSVLYTAAHHANEWITSLVVLRFAEELAEAAQTESAVGGVAARQLLEDVTFHFVPMVDPDGVDLVTGALAPEDPAYRRAEELAAAYPDIPFPLGWKANLLGVDLNLNYPAGWLTARQIKFSQGYTQPGPRDYVGRAPFNQKETEALGAYTEQTMPALVLAFHAQGREIYWKFKDYAVPGAEELGKTLARVSGYRLADTPYASSFAGYKDWFIQQFRRPGYTIEVGQGENPLPLDQFAQIYRENAPIMIQAALAAKDLPIIEEK